MRLRPLLAAFWREWLRPLVLAGAVILPIKSAVADWEWVPSGSMEPTIVPLEFVAINKLAYDLKVPFTTRHLAVWDNPKRGDIVIFFSPDQDIRLVKRVIGLPGDTILLRGDALTINGVPLSYERWSGPTPLTTDERGYRQGLFAQEDLPGKPHVLMVMPQRPALRDFGPVTVPAGSYFMMGDNRDDSHDSRFFGCVSRDRIVGRAVGIAASFDLQEFACPRFGRFFTKLR
ncbi:MAG TPA: signal peptidase I [Opitutaceae bacterium]|jgi:signal peptidase I|nr:signal peptidase I [Opitutaceae bacterium]